MRQIYLLAVDADAEAAGEVEALLKQRGYVIRRAEEKQGFPPAMRHEITLALWSNNVVFSARQILFTNRAIDAWTEGRLILARLDHAFKPRGLGDVESIDLNFAPARMPGVWKVVEAAQAIEKQIDTRRKEAPVDTPDTSSGGESGADFEHPDLQRQEKLPAKKAEPRGPVPTTIALPLIVGLVVAGAFASFGFLDLPDASNMLIGLAAAVWGLVAGALTAGFARGKASARPETMREREAAPPPAGAAPQSPGTPGDTASRAPVFVSYARSDSSIVYPLVEEVEAAGLDVWIDRDGLQAGVRWAGTIVRAIRESDVFCLMCSAEAFKSDNVRREIYIADKYKRKLLPVRLDMTEMPEDFEYFLIDRQWLNLADADPAERANQLKAALAQ